jgi:predicted nuclease of restriction endonuclease-like (RecB) superfamily
MSQLQTNYPKILEALKVKIKQARYRATVAANIELLQLYWEIGNTILEQQKAEGWGAKVTKRLAIDLKIEFPDVKGLSERNLVYMQTFASSYANVQFTQGTLAEIAYSSNTAITQVPLAQLDSQQKNRIVQGALAQLSWYHHITLLDKVKDVEMRIFYIQETVQNGWSRDIMVHQIESGLHNRKGKILSNFKNTIAPEKSELVQQLFKDLTNLNLYISQKKPKNVTLKMRLLISLPNFY